MIRKGLAELGEVVLDLWYTHDRKELEKPGFDINYERNSLADGNFS